MISHAVSIVARAAQVAALVVVVFVVGGCPLLGLGAATCVDDDSCPSGEICDAGSCAVGVRSEGEGEGEGEGEEGEGEEGEGEEGEGEGEGEGAGPAEFTGVDARIIGGLAFDGASDVALAADGRLFVTAEYTAVNANVGTGAGALTLPADTGDDVAGVVAAFAADGTPLWRRVIGGFLALRGGAADPVAVDEAAGVVYVGGRTGSAAVFGFGDPDVTDASNAWVAALDVDDGAIVWLKTLPSAVRSVTEIVVLDGRVVVLGSFEGTDIDFNGRALSSFAGAGVDIFALGLDGANGSVDWARVFGGSGFDTQPSGVKAGDDVLISFGADDFVHDGTTPTGLSGLTGVVIGLDAADGGQTGRYIDDGGDGELEFGALVGESDGAAWVCGRNDFSSGVDAMLLLRLDPALELVRRRRFEGGSCTGIASDGAGGVIASDLRNLGGVAVDYDDLRVDLPGGNNHSVLVHFDEAGDAVAARVVGVDNSVIDVVRQDAGRVVVTGDFREAFDLDDASYDPAGEADALYLLLDFTPEP